MTHEEKITQWIGSGKTGVEILSAAGPIPGFSPPPIYVDCGIATFATINEASERPFSDSGDIERGRLNALPFHDNCLDYVACFDVLQRLANPVAALAEWYRVLRPGGIIYLVVPNRNATWEHTRAVTPVDHMLEDYVKETTGCDASHIDEFVYDVDWSRYSPDTPADEMPGLRASLARRLHEAVERGEDIDIHFHTFERDNLREFVTTLQCWPKRRFNWEIMDLGAGFPAANPTGIFMALRVQKGWLDRAQADAFEVTAGKNRRAAVIRQNAQGVTTT